MAWQADRLETIGAAGLGFSSSRDGGKTWADPLYLTAKCDRSLTDPAVVATGTTAYLAYIDFPRSHAGFAKLRVATIDTARAEVTRQAAVDRLDTLDKPALAINPSDPSVLYLAWIRREGGEAGKNVVMFASSRDGGRSWGHRVRLDDAIPVEAEGTQVAAFDHGELLVAYSGVAGGREAHVVAVHASQNGEAWYAPHGLMREDKFTVRSGRADLRTGDFFPSVAAGRDGRAAVALQRNDHGRGALVITSSLSFGETWTRPDVVNSVPGSLFTPTLAFAESGALGVSYYRLSGGRVRMYFASRRPSNAAMLGTPRAITASVSLGSIPDRNRFLGDFQSVLSTGEHWLAIYALPVSGAGGPTEILATRIPEPSSAEG